MLAQVKDSNRRQNEIYKHRLSLLLCTPGDSCLFVSPLPPPNPVSDSNTAGNLHFLVFVPPFVGECSSATRWDFAYATVFLHVHEY